MSVWAVLALLVLAAASIAQARTAERWAELSGGKHMAGDPLCVAYAGTTRDRDRGRSCRRCQLDRALGL